MESKEKALLKAIKTVLKGVINKNRVQNALDNYQTLELSETWGDYYKKLFFAAKEIVEE